MRDRYNQGLFPSADRLIMPPKFKRWLKKIRLKSAFVLFTAVVALSLLLCFSYTGSVSPNDALSKVEMGPCEVSILSSPRLLTTDNSSVIPFQNKLTRSFYFPEITGAQRCFVSARRSYKPKRGAVSCEIHIAWYGNQAKSLQQVLHHC
jgi:hypothetical protein